MDTAKIRVCLKCKKYMILNESYENQQKLKRFNLDHIEHSLITTDYSEINQLQCGKVTCEDDEIEQKYDYVKKK